MNIGENSVVSINYTLTNDDGDMLDSSEGRGPLSYLQGGGNVTAVSDFNLEIRSLTGDWSRAGQITEIGQMLLFTCILDQSRCDDLLADLHDQLVAHIGYVTTTDVSVIRPQKFP